MELSKCEELAKLYNKKKRFEEILEIISKDYSMKIVNHWIDASFELQESIVEIKELDPILNDLYKEAITRVKKIIKDLEGEITRI